MKKRLIRMANCILVAALTIGVLRSALQETLTVEAKKTISQVQQNINGLNEQINGLNQKIDSMQEQQEILEEEMEDLNAEIINTMTSIGMKEDEIAEKETEIVEKQANIEKTAEEYEEAKAQETEQFQNMVIRLRKMYEGGEVGHVDRILSGAGLAESLNRMDYVEKIYEFDRHMLETYEAAKEKVMDLWNQLEEDKLALENDKANLETEKANLELAKANLDVLLEKKKQQSANYAAEIKKARQEANVAKAKLQQEQKELKRLQAEQNKAKPSAAGGNYSSSYNSIISNASGSDLGKQIAQYACQYVGNPYVAGGTSLTNGADCSGFTYRVYHDFGYTLPRTSSDQCNVGTAVDYSNIQPGDIICYPGHVAIYIGDGKIVHASTAKTGIKVSNANYRAFLTIRRII